MNINIKGTDLDLIFVILILVTAPVILLFMLISSVKSVYIYAIPFAIISGLIWLFLRKRDSYRTKFESSKRVVWFGASVFFLLFTASIIILYTSDNVYERPFFYFIIVSIMAGIVAMEILHASHSWQFLILGQIAILCCLAVFSQVLIFPDLVGIDPYYHRNVVQGLIDQGAMPSYSGNYRNMPTYHILLGSSQLLTSLDFKLALLLTASATILLLNILFIYLLAKHITSDYRSALFASLIVGQVSFHVQGAYLAYPNTLAIALVIVFLYLLVKKESNRLHYSILLGIVFLTTMLMHSIATLFIIMTMIVLYISSKIFTNLSTGIKISPIHIFVSIVLAITLWSWMGQLYILEKFLKALGNIGVSQALGNMISPSISDQLINYTGIFIFYSISFVGILALFYHRGRFPRGVPISLVSITPLIVGIFFLLFNLYGLNERWWYISQVLLSIPAGVALWVFSRSIKRPCFRTITISMFIVYLSFFLAINTFSNIDNDSFTPSMSIRYTLITSELSAPDAISTMSGAPLQTDDYYGLRLSQFGHYTSTMTNELTYANFSTLKGIVLLRDEVTSGAFENAIRPTQLNYSPEEILYGLSYNKIYDCHTVAAFIRI